MPALVGHDHCHSNGWEVLQVQRRNPRPFLIYTNKSIRYVQRSKISYLLWHQHLFFASDLNILLPGSHVMPDVLVLASMNLYSKEFYDTENIFYA